jgi:hypothetical protein
MDDRAPTGDAAAPGKGSQLALLPWVLAVLTGGAVLLYQVPWTVSSTPVPAHERSLANLRAAETGAVRREVGDRFYYLSRRHGNAPLRWGVPEDSERWAFCIRCPVSLQAVAPDVRSIAYVRSSLGQNIIVEMRGEQGRPILTREQVLTTLRDNVERTKPRVSTH